MQLTPALNGPPIRAGVALRAIVERPESLSRPVRENRQRWFLTDRPGTVTVP